MENSEEIQLILFHAYGTGIGFDAAQVQSIANANGAGAPALHSCFANRNFSADYINSRWIFFKNSPGQPYEFEEPSDIITVRKADINGIPAILKKTIGGSGLWGIFQKSPQIYYLYDADMLIRGKNEKH